MKAVRGRATVRTTVIGAFSNVAALLPLYLTGALAVQLTDDLSFDVAELGLTVGAYWAAGAMTSLHLGRLADRLGAVVSLRVATVLALGTCVGIATGVRAWYELMLFLVIGGSANALSQPAANRLLITNVPSSSRGVAFGFKQSAAPIAAMLAGFSVPGIAVTYGWRFSFALAGLVPVVVLLALRDSSLAAPIARHETSRPKSLGSKTTVAALALGFGLATAAGSTISTFLVDASVQAGSSPGFAGFALAVASIAAISVRLLSGLASDRMQAGHLTLCAAMVFIGAAGFSLLALGRPGAMLVGSAIGLAGIWGFQGVFWFALTRAYWHAPGAITGAVSPGAFIGGVVGPAAFGSIVNIAAYRPAWLLAGVVAVIAATVMWRTGRQLPRFPADTLDADRAWARG